MLTSNAYLEMLDWPAWKAAGNQQVENSQQRRNIEQEAKRYAKQCHVSDRRAEIRHSLPDHETTEGPRNQCDADAAENRPDEKIIQHC